MILIVSVAAGIVLARIFFATWPLLLVVAVLAIALVAGSIVFADMTGWDWLWATLSIGGTVLLLREIERRRGKPSG